jgi:hypothetical protein
VPGCVIIFADDAGQIDYFKHETLIRLSKDSFAAPLILMTGIPENLDQLALIYIGNVLLFSAFTILAAICIRYLKIKYNGKHL